MSTPSLLNIPYRFKAGTLYSQLPETGAGDFTVTRTTTVANRSTRINSLGNIELVANNVPRLDYPLGGAVNGCPALLVEPSAQNFFFPSDDFANGITTPSSFGLNNFGSGSVSNTTATLDPFGTNLADYIQENATASIEHRALFTGTSGMVSGTTYTASIFAKSAQRTRFRLYNNAGGGGNVSFNLSNGTITAQSGIPAGASPRIENYGNGWFRCSLPFTPSVSGNFNIIGGLLDASGNPTYNGTGTDGLYIFGLQIEVGSVPTSYIPTTTAAVTRNTETIANTSATALIGQSEGTLYWDIAAVAGVLSGTGNPMFGVRNSATTNWVSFISNSPSSPFRIAAQATTGNLINYTVNITSGKAALAWSSAGLALYVNGSLVATSATNPNFSFSVAEFVGYAPFKANAFAIYPNRIPNTAAPGVLSLATLTTP